MSLYEFLLALGFWQWIGLIILVSLPCQTVACLCQYLLNARKKL